MEGSTQTPFSSVKRPTPYKPSRLLYCFLKEEFADLNGERKHIYIIILYYL